MPKGDPCESSLKCLGESHQTYHCRICRGFRPRTKNERNVRLKHLLPETALPPQLAPGHSVPTPNTLVQSAPASIRESTAPKKDLAPRESQYRHSLAPKMTRHRSHSPVPHKRLKKTDLGCSPTVKSVERDTNSVRPTLGHPALTPLKVVPSTSDLQRIPSSLMSEDSPVRESQMQDLDLPSTPDTF